MIRKISPSKYSKIPESSSSMATVMDFLLYTDINKPKTEIILRIPSDSYFNGIYVLDL